LKSQNHDGNSLIEAFVKLINCLANDNYFLLNPELHESIQLK